MLRSSAAKPVSETGSTEQRVLTFWDQAALLEGRAEVARLLVGDDRPGSLCAVRYWRTTSSNGIASGPANSTVPFNGSSTAILATAAARSSEKIG